MFCLLVNNHSRHCLTADMPGWAEKPQEADSIELKIFIPHWK